MNGKIGELRFRPSTPDSLRPERAAVQRGDAARESAAAGARAGRREESDSVELSAVPPAPPVDVLAEIDQARARAAEIIAAGRELHFAKDSESGRIVVEVRDAQGNVLRTIPPSRALAVMDGKAGLD